MSGRNSKFTIISICLTCGKEIRDRIDRKYCNKSCAAITNGVLFPKRKKQLRPCTACGIPYLPRRYEASRCNDCRANPELKWNSTIKSSTTEQNIRGHARRVMKPFPRQCRVCLYSIYVEVAHIIPIRSFSDDALLGEINAITNLAFLCPNHHKEFDLGLISL